ncbi:pilus assembly protein TadG-related protein [Kribbella sp. NBC_01510]|uniref:pilus assembly protein TadG-related protein n=1 Tax=Kribbella sp. NBC_01510 TaxID=2903581 RepID=UPI003867608F
MTHNEKGSATLHSLFAAVLLLTALAAAILWSTISTARHKLATAADLTALSAAQSLANPAAADASTTASGATTFDITGARTASDLPGPDLTTSSSSALDRTIPCAIAARIAALHKVDLVACHLTPTSVTIQVALDLRLPFTHPTLTTTARAGPL